MIGAIFATDSNGAFGLNNSIPWHLPMDFAHFKTVTINSMIVMGKNTFLSLPGKLPNRKHVVISHDAIFDNDVYVYTSIEDAAESLVNNYWVIGGPSVILGFKKSVDYHVVYHTVVDGLYDHDVSLNYDAVVGDMVLFDTKKFNGFTVYKYVNENKF